MDGFDVPYAGQQVFLKVGRPGSVGEHDALAWGAVGALVSEGGFTDLWNVCVSSSPTLADGGYQTLSEDEDGLEGLACCYLVCQVASVVRLRGKVRALVSVPGREPGAPLISVSLSDLVAFDSTGVESSDAGGPFPPQSPSAFPPQASPGCTLLASYGATSQLGCLYVPVRLLTVERRTASASAVAQVSLRNLRFQLLRTVSVQHLPSGAAMCCPAPDADSNSTIATTASLEEGRCRLAVAHRAVPVTNNPEYLKCLGSSLRGEAQQLLATFQQLSSMPRAALDGLEGVDDLSLLGVAAPGGRSTATSFFDGCVMTEAAGDVTFSFVARLARHSALAAAAVAFCSLPEGQFAPEQPLLTAIRALHCLLAYPLLSVGEWEAGLWAVGRLLTAVCSGDEPVANRFPGLLDDVAAALYDYQECCCDGWLRIVEGWMLGDASVIDAKARAQRESRRGSGSDKDGVAAGVVAVGTQVLTLARVLSRTSEFWPPQKNRTGDHHLDRSWLRQLGLRVLTTALGSAIAELHPPLRDQSVAVASLSPGTRADLLALAAIFKDAFLVLPLASVDGASAAETGIDDRQSLVLADADAEGPPPDQNQDKGKERASEEEFLALLTRCIESSCQGYKKPASRGAVLAQVPPLPAAAASVGALSEFSRVVALRESELLNWLTTHSVLS